MLLTQKGVSPNFPVRKKVSSSLTDIKAQQPHHSRDQDEAYIDSFVEIPHNSLLPHFGLQQVLPKWLRNGEIGDVVYHIANREKYVNPIANHYHFFHQQRFLSL